MRLNSRKFALYLSVLILPFILFSQFVEAVTNVHLSANGKTIFYTDAKGAQQKIDISGGKISAADAALIKPAWEIVDATKKLEITDVMGTHRITGEYGAVQLTNGHALTVGSGTLYLAGIKETGTEGTRPILIIHRHEDPYVVSMQPLQGQSHLFLESGIVDGNLQMNPSTTGNSAATIATSAPYNGAASPDADVIINGNIDVQPGATGISSLIAQSGVKLEIDGDISHNGIPLTNVEATGADLILYANSFSTHPNQSTPASGSITAVNITATNGHSIKAGANSPTDWSGAITADNVAIGANSAIEGKSIAISNPIDGSAASSMAPGSTLAAHGGDIQLKGGVTSASGAISTTAGGDIIAQNASGAYQAIEQGTGSLSLASDGSVTAGDIDVDSVTAANGDIIASTNGSSQPPDGNGVIMATEISAPKGKIQAGTLALAGTSAKEASLKANSLSLANDLNLANGSFSLTGVSNIDGNVNVTNNTNSSLDNLTVGGSVNIGGGNLTGGSLTASDVAFTNGLQANIQSFTLGDSGPKLLQLGYGPADTVSVKFGDLNLGRQGVLNAIGGDAQAGTLEGGNLTISNDNKVRVNNAATLSTLDISGTGSTFSSNSAAINTITASGASKISVANQLDGSTLAASGGANIQANAIAMNNIAASDSAAISAPTITAQNGLTVSDTANVNANTIDGGSGNIVASGKATVTGSTIKTAGDIQLSGEASMVGTDVTANKIDVENKASLTAFGTLKATSATIASEATVRASQLEITDKTNIDEGALKIKDLIIDNVIDGSDDHHFEKGKIDATHDVILKQGVTQASGFILAGVDSGDGSIIAGDGVSGYREINQGAGELNLIAAQGIYASAINVNSVVSNYSNINTPATGSITSPFIMAPQGYVRSGDITATGSVDNDKLKAEVEALFIDANNLSVANGDLRLNGETLSVINNDLNLSNNNKSQFNNLSVGGTATLAGGSLTGEYLGAGSATFTDGIYAQRISTLSLAGSQASSLKVTNTATAERPTTVELDALRLNRGNLFMASDPGQKGASLAVKQLGAKDANSQDMKAHGNIVVGANSLLTIGAADNSWISGLVGPDGAVPNMATGAVMGVATPLILGSGSSIKLDGGLSNVNAMAAGQGLSFGGQSLLAIDGGDPRVRYAGEQVKTVDLPDDVPGAISSDSPVTAHVGPDAKIYIKGVVSGYTYVALGKNITTIYDAAKGRAAGSGWQGVNLYTDNPLVGLERLEDGKEGQFGLVVHPLPPDIDPGHEDIIKPKPDEPDTPVKPPEPEKPDKPDTPVTPPGPDEPINPGPVEPTPPEPVAPLPVTPANPFLNQALWLAQDNPKLAGRTIEGALRMVAIGAVPEMTRAANLAASEAALEQRLKSPVSGEANAMVAAGERARPDFALWATPLYRSLASNGLEAGSLNYDFNGGLGGVVLGGDATWRDRFRLGVMFNIGGVYAKSAGELDQTENNASFWGAGLYGVWWQGPFSLSGDLNFTATYNKLSRDLPTGMEWSKLKSDVTAWGVSAGLQAAYTLATDVIDVTPHAGARYWHLNIDNYSIKGSGGPEVIHGDAASQSLWTFPAGVTFSKNFELANGWRLTPSLDAMVTPKAGEKRLNTTVAYTNMSGDLDLDTQIMDDITYGGVAGIEVQAGNFALGLNYSAQFGLRSSNQGLFGLLRYEF